MKTTRCMPLKTRNKISLSLRGRELHQSHRYHISRGLKRAHRAKRLEKQSIEVISETDLLALAAS